MTITENATEIRPFDPEWLVRRGNYLTLITPAIAVQLLERNVQNRKPKRRAISMYARDMIAGNWNPDASDIKVNRAGDLIDGQNRLMACVEAGVPFPTLLRTGLANEARDHVDQGVRRTVGDTFRMANLADPNNIASAVNLRIRYEVTVREHGGKLTADRRVPQTHQEAIDYLYEHPAIEKYTATAARMQRIMPGVTRSIYIAAISMMAESSEVMAQQFADDFISGATTGTGDPMLALQRYLARQVQATQAQKMRNRSAAMKHLAAFVITWNAWIEKEPVANLVVRDNDTLVLPV